MLVALFSDVHGNLPALELFLSQTASVDQYISLGDIVNYGPWSNECVRRIEALPRVIRIKGNHEDYFLTGEYPGENIIARTFFDHCFPDFKEHEAISKYIPEISFHGYRILHTIENRIIFHDTDIDLATDTILAHSHQQFSVERNGFRLINPGSIGQNRAYINVINYMLWDSETNHFKSCEILYDVDIVINEMRSRKYPAICIDYYKNKKRM
jgi:predicted phosphodiesterase